MTARLASLPKAAQVALTVCALLFVAMVGYFALIAPKNHTAASLKKQTASVQAQIDQNRSSAFTKALPAVRSAPVFSLAQAMPSQLDTPEVILQLNALAHASGISFDQISPGAGGTTTTIPDPSLPFAAYPLQLQFTGSFYNLVTFLQRVRNLVRVQHGNLFTSGRLFDLSDITFSAGPKGFPQIQATLVLNELVPQTPVATAPTTPGSTDTTSTTTAATTTTSNPTSAAPSTSGGS